MFPEGKVYKEGEGAQANQQFPPTLQATTESSV